jgi:hypothetical protein
VAVFNEPEMREDVAADGVIQGFYESVSDKFHVLDTLLMQGSVVGLVTIENIAVAGNISSDGIFVMEGRAGVSSTMMNANGGPGDYVNDGSLVDDFSMHNQ